MTQATKEIFFYPLICVSMIVSLLLLVELTSDTPVPIWFYIVLSSVFYLGSAGLIAYHREREKNAKPEDKLGKKDYYVALISLILTIPVVIFGVLPFVDIDPHAGVELKILTGIGFVIFCVLLVPSYIMVEKIGNVIKKK